MLEMPCQSCGATVAVQSFLTAAQQPCSRCGQLLMGSLGSGTRTARPPEFEDHPPAPQWKHGSESATGPLVGMLAGALAGVAVVAAMAYTGAVIPLQFRGALLGALTGVLLAPVIAVSTFISMFIPFSLEGLLGDSIWTRLATANNERRLGPLVVPILFLLVLPMTLCALGGSRMTAVSTPMVVSAGLGAILLGALVGGIGGTVVGGRRARQ